MSVDNQIAAFAIQSKKYADSTNVWIIYFARRFGLNFWNLCLLVLHAESSSEFMSYQLLFLNTSQHFQREKKKLKHYLTLKVVLMCNAHIWCGAVQCSAAQHMLSMNVHIKVESQFKLLNFIWRYGMVVNEIVCIYREPSERAAHEK